MTFYNQDDDQDFDDRRPPRRKPPSGEVDFIAAVARAIEGEDAFDTDYAAAVARAIEHDAPAQYDYDYAHANRPQRAYRGEHPQSRAQSRPQQPPPQTRPRKKRRLRRFFTKLFLILFLLLGGLFALVFFVLGSPSNHDVFTVLIAGQDNVGAHGLTDTIMLASVDSANGTVDVVSIPRDTRADVSWGGKINSVYAMTGGSTTRLMEEVGKLVGFMPDFYVVLDLQAFVEIVDVLGGVRVDVPFRMLYSDPYDDPPLHIDLQPGLQRLNGAQAMQFVRYRPPVGDLGRVTNQQIFLRAVASESLRPLNIVRVPSFAGIFLEYVETDLPLSGLIYLGRRMMGTGDDSLNFHTMPSEPFGGDLVPVLNPWLDLINTHISPHRTPVTLDNVRLFARVDGTIGAVGGGNLLSRGR